MIGKTINKAAMLELNAHRRELTRQQFKTLKGQILSGDGAGAMKGLCKLIDKRRV